MDLVKKSYQKLYKFVVDVIRVDGVIHASVSFNLTIFFWAFMNWYLAAILSLLAGIAKEVIHDKALNLGYAEWHDIYCNIAGIVLALLTILIHFLIKG